MLFVRNYDVVLYTTTVIVEAWAIDDGVFLLCEPPLTYLFILLFMFKHIRSNRLGILWRWTIPAHGLQSDATLATIAVDRWGPQRRMELSHAG